MSKKLLLAMILAWVVSVSAGCSTHHHHMGQAQAQEIRVIHESYDPVIIRVDGYGATGATDVRTNAQQRELLAMRASKMDAYRALAERVYGIRIQGNTTVQNMAARDDSVRGFVDSMIRGAKVISTTQQSDGTYKTRLELVLEPRFRHCMSSPETLRADPACSVHSVHGEHPSQRVSVRSQPSPRYFLN